MLRNSLPKIALGLTLFAAAFFAFFESVYLSDQASEFGDGKIVMWMWIFRALTAALVVGGLALILVRK